MHLVGIFDDWERIWQVSTTNDISDLLVEKAVICPCCLVCRPTFTLREKERTIFEGRMRKKVFLPVSLLPSSFLSEKWILYLSFFIRCSPFSTSTSSLSSSLLGLKNGTSFLFSFPYIPYIPSVRLPLSLLSSLLRTIFKTPSCLIHGQFRASPPLVATTVTAVIVSFHCTFQLLVSYQDWVELLF